jgi:hypothetical protein
MSASRRQAVARRLLGFAPASPDESGFDYDARLGEVRNLRHGSYARPAPPARLAPGSPLGGLLAELGRVRADLRFREDGIHTVLTIGWKAR